MDKNILAEMLIGLADSFTNERKQQEPYKELFRSGSTFTGLLRKLESEMLNHVLDACEVSKERHGVKVNREQFNILLALPLLAKIAEENAKEHEGSCCCVDKAFFMLSEQFKQAGKMPS